LWLAGHPLGLGCRPLGESRGCGRGKSVPMLEEVRSTCGSFYLQGRVDVEEDVDPGDKEEMGDDEEEA
jgi:hypothetical protein